MFPNNESPSHMKKSKSILSVAAFLISGCASAGGPDLAMLYNDAAVFEKFKKLEGTFREVKGSGDPAIIEYRLISRGTALTETWIMPKGEYGPNGKQELTVFHMDNGALVATHYCAVGIHPTMILDPNSPPGTYNFIPRHISNLDSPDQSHNSGFGYTFDDENTAHRSEIWTISGEEKESHLTMVRAPK